MSEEEFSTILQQQEVTSPHLETKIVIYLQRNPNISTPGKPWNKGDSLWLWNRMSLFSSPRLIAHGPHLSSLHKPRLRCGVASAWQPQRLATNKINSCRTRHQQYFPRCRQRKKFYDYRNLYHFKNAQKCDLYIQTWPEWPGSSMDMGKYHMNYKVFERVLQDFLHQQSTVAEKRSDKHTGKVPVKHTFTIKHSNSLLRTCLS